MTPPPPLGVENVKIRKNSEKIRGPAFPALCIALYSHLLYSMFIHVSFVFTHIKTKMGNFLGSRDGGVEAEPGIV